MSFTGIRLAVNGASRVLNNSVRVSNSLPAARSLFHPSSIVNPNRYFTRSLWFMNQSKECRNNSVNHRASKMCGCCGLHTQGDKDMAEFLADEIKLEESNDQSQGQLPQVQGFSVLKSNGAEVALRKSAHGETVTVRFNVNHSVDDEGMDEQTEESQVQMVSRPAFTVEINKGSSKTLAIHCQFPAPGMVDQQDQEQYEDAIEISEITVLDNNDGDWEDSRYVMGGAVMDGNLYDMLLKMMEERGVTAETIDQLTEFATQYDHNQYVGLLKAVKDFALEK